MHTTWGIALGVAALACGVMAQGVATPEMQVPAIREPHHFVKLDNKYARVLDVTVAPFSGTLYHIHENPYFWISIGRRDSARADAGRRRDRQHRPRGCRSTVFAGHHASRRQHRRDRLSKHHRADSGTRRRVAGGSRFWRHRGRPGIRRNLPSTTPSSASSA